MVQAARTGRPRRTSGQETKLKTRKSHTIMNSLRGRVPDIGKLMVTPEEDGVWGLEGTQQVIMP